MCTLGGGGAEAGERCSLDTAQTRAARDGYKVRGYDWLQPASQNAVQPASSANRRAPTQLRRGDLQPFSLASTSQHQAGICAPAKGDAFAQSMLSPIPPAWR